MIEHDEINGVSETIQEIDFDFISESSSINEKLLLILNRETGLAPYSHEFVEGFQDPQILSGFISAISSFMGEVTGKNHLQWKTVFGSDSIMLVEGGDWSIGVLVASKETIELRSKLRGLVREFEDCFEFLRDIEGIQNIFSDFDNYVRRMFVDERVTNRTIVTKVPDWRNSMSKFNLPSISFDTLKALLGFEKSATVQEITETQNIRNDKVIEIVSNAFWNGIIQLTYIPSDDDILNLSEKASSILFSKSNPLNLSSSCLRIVARFDGRTPFSQFINNVTIPDKELVLRDLGSLINSGFIQRISVEKRLVLFNECILSQLISKGASIVGSEKMMQFFEAVSVLGSSIHPRVSRIVLLENMHVMCILEENMAPGDLDDMFNALEYFIDKITKHLSKSNGIILAENLVERIRKECRLNWIPYLTDLVI